MLLVVCLTVLGALFAPAYTQQESGNRAPYFTDDLQKTLVTDGVYENTTIGTVLGKLQCKDPDGDAIAYSVSSTSFLRIRDFRTGEVVLLDTLDREQSVYSSDAENKERPFTVRFECIDYRGTETLSPIPTSIEYPINILDNNDNIPFIEAGVQGFSFKVNETAPAGTVLNGTIKVTDIDEGPNARLSSLGFLCPDANDQVPCEMFSIENTQLAEGRYEAHITLRGKLDFETRQSYRMQLRAVDGEGSSEKKNTASLGIRIEVVDNQDTDPVFTNQIYTFDVTEGMGVGTAISFSLSARDGDKEGKREIHFEILDDPNGYNLFRPGSSAPVPGSGFGGNRVAVYAAPLIVNTEIDRENNAVINGYSFKAKAIELDESGAETNATAIAEFTVNILDINDNSPTFTQTNFNISLAEMGERSAAVQIPNLRIEVIDPDEPSNARYRLQIVTQTFSGAFGVTPDSVVSSLQFFYLTVNSFQYLDYDEPSYRRQLVTLKAVEWLNNQQGTRSSSATVTVHLEDINDNFPIFSAVTYEDSIVENAINNTSILQVAATDKDSGLNGEFTFSLQDSVKNLFYVTPNTGIISLIGKLDYEQQTDYSFLVFAIDKGKPSKTSQVPVRIRITDYNDVGPKFTLSKYSGRVTESSLIFESPVQVTARDPDPSANITYRIVSGNTPTNSFVLNVNTGVLSLREKLNFENTPNRTGIYSLVVEASDNGSPPETSQSIITITVIDENNHAPIFSPARYNRTLSEAVSPGTLVVRVYATDADFGTNGDISYRIGTGRGRDNFMVTKNGTVLVSNSPNFDFDELDRMIIDIVAIDGGSPLQSSTATMTVSITDANNKLPVFQTNLYNAIVDETSAVNDYVIRVSATDPDSTSVIRYSIDKSSMTAINAAGTQVLSIFNYDFTDSFKIDASSGVITVNSKLDRNYVVELSFQVVAEDVDVNAIGKQTATSQVTINIRGQPDRELYFNPPWTTEDPVYEVPILESAPVHSEIMTLQARDPSDFDSVLTDYMEVPNSDPGDYFSIITVNKPTGRTPGVVILNRELDFESGQLMFSVVVRAVKNDVLNGVPDSRTVTATIVIQVQDFNDNEPVFSQVIYNFQVSESAPVNHVVNTIAAYDRDSATFGPVEFSLGGGLDRDDFKLFQPTEDGTAQVLVAKPLNFERRTEYQIDIIASDNKYRRGSAIRQRGKAVLLIRVLDENDNKPLFNVQDQKRSFSVPETAPVDTVLGTILATDADHGLNGRISYNLALDNSSGSDQALGLFTVNTASGVLYTRAPLRGLSGSYYMKLIAQDAGIPPSSSSVSVIIKVQGAQDDDGTPQWLQPINNYIAHHEENKLGMLNVQLEVKARTEGGGILFSLVEFSNDYLNFWINPTTGEINVTKKLDREEQATYTLVVQATDTKNTTKISRRTIIVELIDQNDNPPSFEKTRYSACPNDFEVPTVFTAIDNTPKGVIVGRAVACDPDAVGNNIPYYYKFTETAFCRSVGGSLSVLLNGSIISSEMLDYDVKPVYKVCVQVFGSPKVSSGRTKRADDMNRTHDVAYIHIKMTDVNDQKPIFKDVPYLSVIETNPSEPTVANVYAVDKDGPEYNKVWYDISDTIFYPHDGGRYYSLKGAFAVDSNTGAITANLPSYDDFRDGYFELTVDAFDIRNRFFNDTVKIKVIVYHRSQVLKVVMNKDPSQGQTLAVALVSELHRTGQPDVSFIFKAASEHRTKDTVVPTQTDCCFVAVQNNRVFETGNGLALLEAAKYNQILIKKEYSVIQKGTCYPVRSSMDSVKWRDLWWVLVVIAIFIFVCCIILIATVCILFNRYKDYMTTEKTYLVPQ